MCDKPLACSAEQEEHIKETWVSDETKPGFSLWVKAKPEP